jgi:hypothetical protein
MSPFTQMHRTSRAVGRSLRKCRKTRRRLQPVRIGGVVVKRHLPEGAHRVTTDRLIGGDDREPLGDRLADQCAVEGIAVQGGQPGQLRDGLFVQGERVDAVRLALLDQETLGCYAGMLDLEAARLVLDQNFPKRRRRSRWSLPPRPAPGMRTDVPWLHERLQPSWFFTGLGR